MHQLYALCTVLWHFVAGGHLAHCTVVLCAGGHFVRCPATALLPLWPAPLSSLEHTGAQGSVCPVFNTDSHLVQ